MLEAIDMYLLPTIISNITAIYLQSKILKTKINYNSISLYIGIFISVILVIANRIYVHDYLRFLFSFIILLISGTIIFKRKIYELYGVIFVQQGLMLIAELLCLAVLSTVDQSLLSLSYKNFIGVIAVNILVSLTAVLIYSSKKVSYICDKVISFINDVAGLKKYLILLLFITTSNVLLMFMYYKDDIIILINSAFILIYGFIVYFLILEASEKLHMKQQNEGLLKTLNEYEKILDQQRVSNHENKNQLLVLKSLVSKNNKKLISYLDEMIKEKQVDDEVLYASAKRIPQGGLQGLIYQKMLCMKDKNINIVLNVDRKVKKINLPSKINFEICRAVGIIVDNAIDETMKLEDREILIDIYQENEELVVEVTNRCNDIPDLSRIDESGYTTKEKGHGYGLTLLKEICSNNNITNERKIVGNTFCQTIKIKM